MRPHFNRVAWQGAYLLLGHLLVFSASITTDCTLLTTISLTHTITEPPHYSTIVVRDETVTITYHVTPFRNGTTVTRTEYPTSGSPSPVAKRTTRPSDPSFEIISKQRPFNATFPSPSSTQHPSLSECKTLNTTSTKVTTITLPGETVTITYVDITITATTLFDYYDISPGNFQPIKTESAINSVNVPLPAATPTASPIGTLTAINKPSAVPENRSPTQTPVGKSQPNPSGSAKASSDAFIVPSGEGAETPSQPIATLPGIGLTELGPSHTAILINNVVDPIVPGQQTTIHDIPISFDTSGFFVVVNNTQTVPLTPNNAPTGTPAGTAIALSAILSNLQPGHATVIGPYTISVDESSSALIIATSTIPLTAAPSTLFVQLTPTLPSELASGFSFLPASAGGLLLPNGQTLAPGHATTYASVPISLASGTGTVVVVDGTLSITATGTAGGNLASYVPGVNGSTVGSTAATTAKGAEFSGGAMPMAGLWPWYGGWGFDGLVAIAGMVLLW